MTQAQTLEHCKVYGKLFGFDPFLLLAICQQESDFSQYAVRLENGFYRKYVEKDSLATSSEILLSASYGLMQIMGQSLRECGYFDFFLQWYNQNHTDKLNEPLSQVTICKGIDQLMEEPAWQVEFGTRHFDKKVKIAKGDIHKGLQFWNGGGNPHYADEVFARIEKLRGEI